MQRKYFKRQVDDYIYITDDGNEFNSRYSAIMHEAMITKRQFRDIPRKTIECPLTDSYITIYKINSKEDWDYLYKAEWYQEIDGDQYTGPGWYGVIQHDGGDYQDCYEIIRMDHYIDNLVKYLTELKDLTNL